MGSIRVLRGCMSSPPQWKLIAAMNESGLRTPLARALLYSPRLVPTDLQQPAAALDRLALQQHVDGEPFKEDREPTPWLGPRRGDLHDAVLRAFHPRQPGLVGGLELARAQVPPSLLSAVIINRQ